METDGSSRGLTPVAFEGIPTRAIRDPRLSKEELRLLIAIAIYGAQGGFCLADIEALAQATQLPASAVPPAIERLEAALYVVSCKGRAACNCRLISDEVWAQLPRLRLQRRKAQRDLAAVEAQSRNRPRGPRSLTSALLRRNSLPTAWNEKKGDGQSSSPTHPADRIASSSFGRPAHDRFQLWLRFVLSAEQMAAYKEWMIRNRYVVENFVQKFDRARDDSDLESLLADVLSITDNPL